MHAEPHFRTLCHYQIVRLIPFLSETRLKGKDFPEVARPPWAQEVPGSNPGAPTKYIFRIFVGLKKTLFTSNFTVEVRQTGGLDSQVV